MPSTQQTNHQACTHSCDTSSKAITCSHKQLKQQLLCTALLLHLYNGRAHHVHSLTHQKLAPIQTTRLLLLRPQLPAKTAHKPPASMRPLLSRLDVSRIYLDGKTQDVGPEPCAPGALLLGVQTIDSPGVYQMPRALQTVRPQPTQTAR
jgi:hypothetical protein